MDLCKQRLEPKSLHNLVMQDLQQPVVFHGLIQEWPASVWTPQDLASVLGDKKVKIRIGLKEAKQWECTQWEASCSYEMTTLNHFCDWLRQDHDTPQDRQGANPLLIYNQATHWCYVDYKYMAELFEGHPHILKAIRWGDFGFSGRDGQQSTVWIGSQGATTPGHYDSYGCNLVAQIYGRKKWHLFPPNQSDALYQTRIPYEESSVFSPINISKPDLKMFPQFSAATPYIVTLDPGDVLFVPRHWWHFVETIETSISVNTWIEMENDHADRLQEAITRALVSGLLPSAGKHCKSKWLNPTEELCDTATNMEYLKVAANTLSQHQKKMDKTDGQNQTTSHQHAKHQVVHIPIHDQSSSHKLDVPEDEYTLDEPLVKRRKEVMQTSSDTVPDCVTLVPCMGQIYKKCEAKCKDKKHTDDKAEQACNNDMFQECSDFKSLNKDMIENQVPKSSKSVDGVLQADDIGDGEGDGIFELFLQSVTHPEVVDHIADILCKKLKEKEDCETSKMLTFQDV